MVLEEVENAELLKKHAIIIIKIYSKEFFFEKFFEYCEAHDSYNKAYEALENEYELNFGARVFPSYDAFRKSKERYLKKIHEKGQKSQVFKHL